MTPPDRLAPASPSHDHHRPFFLRLNSHPLLALWCAAGIVLLLASAWALHYTRQWQPNGQLAATVWQEGSERPPDTVLDASLDPLHLAEARGLDPRAPFLAEWEGLLAAATGGTYRLRFRADDGVAVWVDGVLVLDERTHRGAGEWMVPVVLDAGLHSFRLRYVQRGGDGILRMSWARPEWRENFEAMALMPDGTPPPPFRRVSKALSYPLHIGLAWGGWILAGLVLAMARLLEHLAQRPLRVTLGWRELGLLALVGLPLLAATVDVGTHPWRGWGPDEIHPRDIIGAVRESFSNGWHHLYPPLHFYVLGLVNLPLHLLEQREWLAFSDPRVLAAMHTLDRMVSVAYGWLALLATALLADITIGARARWLAPLMALGVPIFAFYSRTTNVDMAYTFWVTASALALLGAIGTGHWRAYALLGTTAAAAIATKDQAYGYFPGAALVLLWLSWRHTAAHAPLQRIARTLTDTRLWAGLAACLLTYSVIAGVWWNLEGVRGHVAIITGPASTPFRMFPATPSGFGTLALTTAAVAGQTCGLLVMLLAVFGVGIVASQGRSYRQLVILQVMPAAYLITFVGMVGYVYDRFLVAIVPFVALFAAIGADWLLQFVHQATIRRRVAAVLVVVALWPTACLAWLQATDTRLQLEAWMLDNLPPDPLVVGVGTPHYLPNLLPYQYRMVGYGGPESLLAWNADALVFNTYWHERPEQPPLGQVTRAIAGAGFREAVTLERPLPPLWQRVLASSLDLDPVYSNLSKVSPPVSVWVYEAPPPAASERTILAADPPADLGGLLVFESNRLGREKLFLLDIATRDVSPLTTGADHRDEDPAVSPDGTRVAFTTTRFDGNTYDIAVMDLSGGVVRRVTSDEAFERHPAWTPDGRGLLLSSVANGPEAVLHVDADGGTATRLLSLPHRALQPSLSPDGRRVAYTAGTDTGLAIAVADIGGGAPRVLTSPPGHAVRPRWSPDGSHLAYTRLTPYGSFVEILNVAAGDTRTLAVEGLQALNDPSWSPDGRWLAVSGSTQLGLFADWDLFLVRVDDPGHAEAFRLTSGGGNDRAPSWVTR